MTMNRNSTGNNVEAHGDIAPTCPGILLVPVYLFKFHEYGGCFKDRTTTEEVYLVVPKVNIRHPFRKCRGRFNGRKSVCNG